jgi:phenylacetate-coenzyme A ligase PaaK-like adenylate-forming protein
MNEGLSASPLYRTVWIRPLAKKNIISVLRPFRQYLQTVGLAASSSELENLMQDFFQAGLQRIRPIGAMTDSYIGEPHDGIFALRSFCQKISYTDNGLMDKRATLLLNSKASYKATQKIMTKDDFQNQIIDPNHSQLFFHSGGSSGQPKLSVFSYDDYNRQMEVAAEGLFAAGLDPRSDRCMNLFYAGNLYGGFVSFFTILEKLEVVHFPMGASTDFDLVADTIVKNNVTTLLGMPSYLMQLFSHSSDVLKKYSGIKKIFFGGEHFSEAQQNYLKNTFDVEIIRSASYGSVDAGPLGFQCEYSSGGIHHLNERLHDLEVVALFEDTPVKLGEVGRFLFTSKIRHGQKIIRYEIGDVGRIINEDCGCGRTGVRFELLGRHGDVFRIGTIFLSYQKFQKILLDKIDGPGSFQLHLFPGTEKNKEKVLLLLEKTEVQSFSKEKLRTLLIEAYPELVEVVIKDQVLDFEVEIKNISELEHNPKTGKLRSVIDHRS